MNFDWPMGPNTGGDPFHKQPLRDRKTQLIYVTPDGRAAAVYSGGRVLPESVEAVRRFIERHKQEGKK